MFQRFMVIVNNIRANVVVLPYDHHDIGLSSSCILWIVACGVGRSRPS
jgi:hypothetical protein